MTMKYIKLNEQRIHSFNTKILIEAGFDFEFSFNIYFDINNNKQVFENNARFITPKYLMN